MLNYFLTSLFICDLADAVYRSANLKKLEAIDAVERMLEIIKSTLEVGQPILISGFGKFEVKAKKPRRGRNPQRGTDLILDARKVMTFKCSRSLRE